jgi:hypothetical protein
MGTLGLTNSFTIKYEDRLLPESLRRAEALRSTCEADFE